MAQGIHAGWHRRTAVSRRRRAWTHASAAWRAAACGLLAAVVSGCGSDGTITVKTPGGGGDASAIVRGTVYAPNGEIARVDSWPSWFRAPSLWSVAYAASNPNVRPIGGGAVVSLIRVTQVDAADGKIESAVLLGQALTNLDGAYEITGNSSSQVGECGLMSAVGGGELLMRAFALTPVTDIDVCSETTVRIVLWRLTQAPPAQLCDFDSRELRILQTVVCDATFTATGSDVPELNFNAFQLALGDACVNDAIQKATGEDVDGTPEQCLRFYTS